MQRRMIILGLVLLLAGLLAACGGDSDDESGEGGDDPDDINAVVEGAATQLDEASAFQLRLVVEGAPVFLDSENIGFDLPIQFRSAEGVFATPDGLGGIVSLQIEDVTAQADLVVIGPDQYVRHPLITLNNWQLLTFSPDFNPENLTGGDLSIPAAMRSLQNVEYIGREDVDGIEMYHVRGQVEAEQVNAVTVGLIGDNPGLIQADLFIRTRDDRLELLQLEEPLPEGADEPTTWRIELYDYNGDYAVTRPKLAGE